MRRRELHLTIVPAWAFKPRADLNSQGAQATAHGLRGQWMVYAQAHKGTALRGSQRVQAWHEQQAAT